MKNLSVTRIRKGAQQVGDVEVVTDIVVNTKECAKLHDVHERSQLIGEFLDWLMNERHLTLCRCDRYDRYEPASVTIQCLLAEYFEIDENAVENERRALLEAIRR